MKAKGISLLERFLAVYLLCVLLPSGIVGGILYAGDMRSIRENDMEEAYRNAAQAASLMEEILRDERRISSQILANRELRTAIRLQSQRTEWAEQFEDFLRWKEAASVLPFSAECALQFYFEVPTMYTVIPMYQTLSALEENGVLEELLFQGQTTFRCRQWHNLSAPNAEHVISVYRLLTPADGSADRLVTEYAVDAEWALAHYTGAMLPDWTEIRLMDGQGRSLISIGEASATDGFGALEANSYGYDERLFAAKVSLPLADWSLLVVRDIGQIASYPGVMETSVRYMIPAVVLSFGLSALYFLWIERRLHRIARWTNRMSDYETAKDIAIEHRDSIGRLEGHMNDMLHKLREMIREIRENEERRRDAEMRMLLLQINPHFLYNALESINWRAVDHGEEEISQSIIELSRFLRRTFAHVGYVTSLASELDQARSYMRIQQKSMRREVRLILDVPKELMDAEAPHLSLQPLVENSLVHGSKERREADGEIRIRVRREADELLFSVTDDGAGITPARLAQIRERLRGEQRKDDCLALWNVNYRLCAQYGHLSALRIEAAEGVGTMIAFRIPYRPYSAPEEETIG